MKTFEQHIDSDTYYAIRWLSMSTKKFDGELEGYFKSTEEVLYYISHLDFNMYGEEFKIVQVQETLISKADIKMWKETNKYNI